MTRIVPNLWYEKDARAAAEFYATLIPNSHVDGAETAAVDNPSTPKGAELVVHFTLDGVRFTGINGGPMFPQSEAFSISYTCEDQAEVDRLWEAITANGGAESMCGWCKDRWGVSWQIVPKRLFELLADPARAEAATRAMLTMRKLVVADLEAAAA